MDFIFLETIQLETLIGVYDFERHAKQKIEVDLKIALPSRMACKSDHIDDTIHYGLVVERLQKLLLEKQFFLLEALAECIAMVILEEFHAPWVRVTVVKPEILPNTVKVGVQIERQKAGSTKAIPQIKQQKADTATAS